MFSKAVTSGKPIIIDFYADWCTPCRQLDNKTFHDRNVVRESAKFSMIKVDLTKGSDPDVTQLLKKYEVKGVPTVIFLDSHGVARKELETVDFAPGNEFLMKMKIVQGY
jgi:thiol:disulfide interchange protein DsbD